MPIGDRTSTPIDNEAQAIAALPCIDGLSIDPPDLTPGRPPRFFATPEDVANLRRIAEAAHGVGKIWEAAVGNRNYRAEALKHDPAFVPAADDLSALYAGFRTLLA